ncbi:MAG: diguanylate cyclase [Desulfovibrio sp.]|nr:diguanylate cyclase [Desulfovibrio sp.]
MTATIGISLYQSRDDTYENLYSRADMALYRAKDKGKNQ